MMNPEKLWLCMPALMMAGCAVESLTSIPATLGTEHGSEVTDLARVEVNPLAPADLTSSGLTTAVLDAANAAAMGGTDDARKVLTFAVGCALDTTQTISFTVDDTPYAITGGLGVAPAWTSRALTASEAALVSACLFAHASDEPSIIWISVRAQTGLTTTSGELAEFQIEEGAFWGNAFVDLDTVAAYSCDGVDQAANDTYADLPYRQCAQWDRVAGSHTSPCGMSYAGLCSAVCLTATAPYTGCSFLGGTASNTVVTTFLAGAPE
jgi:hypothetical protein